MESGGGGWSFVNLQQSRLNQLRLELGTASSGLAKTLKADLLRPQKTLYRNPYRSL